MSMRSSDDVSVDQMIIPHCKNGAKHKAVVILSTDPIKFSKGGIQLPIKKVSIVKCSTCGHNGRVSDNGIEIEWDTVGFIFPD